MTMEEASQTTQRRCSWRCSASCRRGSRDDAVVEGVDRIGPGPSWLLALKKTKNTTQTSRAGTKKTTEDGYGRSGAIGMRQELSGFCLLKKKEEQEKGKDGGGKRETLGRGAAAL